MASLPLSLLAVITCLVRASWQQSDPVQNFCRRFGHQSTVIDDKLYIDGGLINWNPISTYPQNYSNTWLSYQDLEHNGASGMPQLHANLSKNATIPDVSGGILWGDNVNKRFYLFGGEYYDTPPPPSNLYSYDVLNDWWDDLGPVSGSGSDINQVSYGAGVGISELGLGFYYGGWLSNNSVSGWSGPRMATSGLVKFDMDQGSWTNNTGPDSVRRAGGSMNYIPASDGGMLIYFGGVRDPNGNGSTVGQPMDEIFIYDIFTGQWYTQKTSGTTPQMRQEFCSGVTWADDQSSYNIYLYGGAGMPPDTAGYDDVYILSIPTFTWIKLYPNDGNVTGQYPHHGLTCNVVNSGQMLVIGGTFPMSDGCDSAPQWGTHNLVLGQQAEADANPWELFSPNLTTYAVPDAIISVVGGESTGGATNTAPSGGFDNTDLRVLMAKTASAATRTPTRAIPGANSTGESSPQGGTAHLSGGAIAGIAVGGSVALVAALAGLCVFVRRHRRFRYGAASASSGGGGGGGGAGRRAAGLKSSAAGSSSNGAWPRHGHGGSPPWSPETPGSFQQRPPSLFERRPSNINVQQGPAELDASVPVAEVAAYETYRGGGQQGGEGAGEAGGMGMGVGMGMVPRTLRPSGRSISSRHMAAGDQQHPESDDSGRPWYPRASGVEDRPYSSPRSVSYHGAGYSPATPTSRTLTADPQEMSAEPKGSDSGWEGGGTGSSSGQTGSGSGEEWRERRHTTFYNP